MDACVAYHMERVRGIKERRHIQCDEIWGFVYAKEGNLDYAKAAPEHAGDTWTWTALDTAQQADRQLQGRPPRRRDRVGIHG